MWRVPLTEHGASGNKLSLPGFMATHGRLERSGAVLRALVDFGHV